MVKSDGDRREFLQQEERCGFVVTAERKRLWKTLLEMLEIFINVCNKYGLKYALSDGSLLGAIRHGGIIPWDDDVDVVMPRNDYEKLLTLLPGELPNEYTMQTTATDPEYGITHMKIRNVQTSAIPLYHVKSHYVYNMGVFLDVFPLDGLATDRGALSRQKRQLQLLKLFHAIAFRRDCRGWKKIVSMIAHMAFNIIGSKRYQYIREKVASRYSFDLSENCVEALAEFGDRVVHKSKWYEELLVVKFEYLECYAPKEYDALLTATYGDWHKLVRGGGLHGEIVFDLDKDYKTKLIEEYGYSAKEFERRGL